MRNIIVRTITFQRTNNCGAALQAFALESFLSSFCKDVAIVDYCPEWVEKNRNTFKSIIRRRSKKEILTLPILIIRNGRFESFVKNHCRLTEVVRSSDELIKKIQCDYFIVGSDQVWNPEITGGFDNTYLLKIDSEAKRISYAASCGLDDIKQDVILPIVDAINNFDAVSVRELSFENALKRNGAKNIITVLDPTFLLSAKEYRKIAKYYNFSNYVLIYTMHESEELRKIAKKIADKYNLKVLDTSKILKKWPADIVKRCVGPQQFLGLVDNASFVVTNSFHGTALSIVFRKDFYSMEAGNRSSRLISLLNEFNLSERFIESASSLVNISTVNYSMVDKLIEEKCEQSRAFLLNNVV